MSKASSVSAFAALILAGGAAGQTCTTYPNTLTNGTIADANQVMANFNCAALKGNASFTGNVGFGTTTPVSAIDVTGTVHILGNTASPNLTSEGLNLNWNMLTLGTGESDFINNLGLGSGGFAFMQTPNSGTPVTTLMFLNGAGNLGIGTTSPQSTVDLGASLSTIKLAVWDNGGTGIYGIGVAPNELTFGAGIAVNATPQMVLQANGYFGIGTTTPSYPLYVNGTAYAVGAAGALSDIRHKDRVQTLSPGALGVVGRLRPVTFVWKDPKDDGMKGDQIGFIAQEVQGVLPSVVLTENNQEKTLGIKYDEIIPVLTKAIQEQQAEIATLQAEVVALKKAARTGGQ